jgi:hypothetical protein
METYERHEFSKGQLDTRADPYFYDRRIFREQPESPPPPPPAKTAKKANLKNRKI